MQGLSNRSSKMALFECGLLSSCLALVQHLDSIKSKLHLDLLSAVNNPGSFPLVGPVQWLLSSRS